MIIILFAFLLFVVLPVVAALLSGDNDTIDVKSLYNYADETFRERLRELDQEEKDAEACETIDSYDDAMLDIHARRIDLLKEYGFYA